MKRLILSVFLLIFCLTAYNNAYSYWIWTPKTGKWVNPKTAVKPTPKEQFAYAKDLYDRKQYEDAKKEFKRLLKEYPKSFEASESQYYIGVIEETSKSLYEAYKSYQKVIDKYPFSERINEIIEREYKIAEAFMSSDKKRSLGVALGAENPAIEIFNKVVDNSKYGPFASRAQYKLGLMLKSLMRYYEAEEAFNKVIANYPDSEWVEASRFQIALCRQALSKGPDYDQGASQEAKTKFEEFVKDNPDATLSNEAEKNISQLNEKEAESNYNIGVFYEKQKNYESAKIYYNDVVEAHANSAWAVKALERLQVMEKRKNR